MSPHPRLLRERQGARARANFNLVAPLTGASCPATDMRTTDTAGQLDLFSEAGPASGAVALPFSLEGGDFRRVDVDSAIDGSTPTTVPMPGTRTSTTATRTTGTRTTRTGRARSADRIGTGFSFGELLDAWLDCRKTKRNTPNALAFEANAESGLVGLYESLLDGTYQPGPSTCFVIKRPRPREVWAAGFRDRIVHHLLYNRISPRFERAFIADSCACIPGRGTLYAARRLEAKIRSQTQDWSRPGFYLKCDLANFFVAIHKPTLRELLAARILEPWWRALAELILFHDPRHGVKLKASSSELALIPRHKSLFNQSAEFGLPIGNLSSQFFANVYLDALDQFVKHRLRARHYIRYVDDFVLLHESPQQLNVWLAAISSFLDQNLHLRLNPTKTILQPLDRGVDFVGQLIHPWRTVTRRRTVRAAVHRLLSMPDDEVYAAGNSYLGMVRQASHSHNDQARIANALRVRGHSVNHPLTKCYP